MEREHRLHCKQALDGDRRRHTSVIKPSELSAAQIELITRVMHDAGLPQGVFNIVTGRGDTVGAEITRHSDIAKISFTGSTAVGKAIARGAVDSMKRVTLELGGKSPTVLLDDADFGKAIPLAALASVMNNGQACIAGTRPLVPEGRVREAYERVVSAFRELVVGPTRDLRVNIGPMVTRKQYERVQDYIRKGIDEGATLLIGGLGRPAGLERGYFVRPTVFGHVSNDMTIAREEIFGPVLSIIAYRGDDEAIRIANDRPYRLHAYVFGADLARANAAAPHDGIRVDLDPREMTALLLEMGLQLSNDQGDPPAVSVERADDVMLDVFVRVLRLLDRPRDLPVPGRLIKQELMYHLVSGPGGATLCHGTVGGQRERAVGEAIDWIRTHYNEPLCIDALARTVHMSPSVLHRRFKAATVMSPLQYQKQIRLLEARKMLMSGDAEAASVAYEVGMKACLSSTANIAACSVRRH